MKQDAKIKQIAFERAAQVAKEAAAATRQDPPHGMVDLTPDAGSNGRSGFRLKSLFIRRVPRPSAA
jgi:hypothetical protein